MPANLNGDQFGRNPHFTIYASKRRPRTHGNVFLRFCIVYCSQGNRKQPAYYLKQYKNAGKRFRVYGCLIYFYNFIVLFSDQLANIVKNVLKIIVVNKGKSKIWNQNLKNFKHITRLHLIKLILIYCSLLRVLKSCFYSFKKELWIRSTPWTRMSEKNLPYFLAKQDTVSNSNFYRKTKCHSLVRELRSNADASDDFGTPWV